MRSNLTRFSDRVEDYLKYRPSYPVALLPFLKETLLLLPDHTVADIGSGTGISSEPFVRNNHLVYGVEPNPEMRQAAEQMFAAQPNFVSVDGTAENSNLANHSIDLIFCGQAFHWFDPATTKTEFQRILKPAGHVMLAWNERQEHSPFQLAYEQILKENIAEYRNASHRLISEEIIRRFLEPAGMQSATFENFQFLDLDGLKGRLKSSSYCPKSGVVHDHLMQEMEHLFSRYEKQGQIRFDYTTKIYWNTI